MKRTLVRQRGMTAVLAMLFLVLFSTLAVGFYASVMVSNEVTTNDANVARAFMASESGMDYMRYQLANVNLSPTIPPDRVLDELYVQLQAQMNGTGNLAGHTIAK